ncbi:MAG TPA: hypothetical protein VHV49_00325 [Pseudonocardiaceae bacterium]|nr:hypothetical protein [Pseudonocardiaceae bacterium]
MFTPDPIPRPSGPPASSTPLHDYFETPRPGADVGYAVLPRSLVEAMPLPWQQQLTYLLSEFHQAFAHVTWPIYRVQPSRHERLTDLDEDQLAEVGFLVEIDPDGEVVYRDRAGRVVERPTETTVLVSCLDPIPPPRSATAQQHPNQQAAPRPGPVVQAPPTAPPPAPPPVMHPTVPADPADTPPHGLSIQQTTMPPPGETFGPTGYQGRSYRGRHDQPW